MMNVWLNRTFLNFSSAPKKAIVSGRLDRRENACYQSMKSTLARLYRSIKRAATVLDAEFSKSTARYFRAVKSKSKPMNCIQTTS